ncbi:hypothetical protein [Posidoniimonas polymericola]|uniref:hypothetical protein n=1 Tax=Posidoniimonas polymericola TaxID=2528002 RepID=UPI0018D321D8|nr:hypothetical protein [Posidoniimonas polymericola]
MLQLPTPTAPVDASLVACVAGVDMGSHSAKVVLASVAAPRRVLAAARLVYDTPTAGDPIRQARFIGDWLRRCSSHPVRGVTCSLPQSLIDYEASPLDADAGPIGAVASDKLTELLGGEAARVTADHWITDASGGRRVLHLLWSSTDLACGVAREFDEHRMTCRRLVASPATLGLVAAGAGEGAHLVVDLGHSRATIALVDGGRVLFARPRVALDASAALDHLQQLAGLSRGSAETIATGQGGGVQSAGVSELVHEAFDQWLRGLHFELSRTLTYLDAAGLGAEPGSILLCGGGAAVRGVGDWTSSRLSLPVRACPPPASASWEAAEPYSPVFAAAAAIATAEEAP